MAVETASGSAVTVGGARMTVAVGRCVEVGSGARVGVGLDLVALAVAGVDGV